jgi:hypothetical protein
MRGESDVIDAAHTPIDEWRPASVGDELGADETHVWRASLDQPAEYDREIGASSFAG